MERLYPPYGHSRTVSGEPIDFRVLVSEAGFHLPIVSHRWPEIRLVQGPSFKAWLRPGMFALCVSMDNIAAEPRSKDWHKEILARLAYQFHDWMAKEVFRFAKRRSEIHERSNTNVGNAPMEVDSKHSARP